MTKVMYINIAEGCREPKRYRKLVNFVVEQGPDVLGMSELNGWDGNNFAKLNGFKRETGLSHSLFCLSPHGYHLALLSKNKLSERHISKRGLWHGVIIAEARVKNQSYVFALTHLSPLSEDSRLDDLGRMLPKLANNRRTILMGDMNAISPQDSINETAMLRKTRKLGIKKFGTDRMRKEVITTILKFGFLDVCHLSNRETRAYTVPAGFFGDANHFTRLHLDYIFVSRDLKPKVKRTGVLRNKETKTISDHYPVFVQFA